MANPDASHAPKKNLISSVAFEMRDPEICFCKSEQTADFYAGETVSRGNAKA